MITLPTTGYINPGYIVKLVSVSFLHHKATIPPTPRLPTVISKYLWGDILKLYQYPIPFKPLLTSLSNY